MRRSLALLSDEDRGGRCGVNYYYHNNAIWLWRVAADGEVTNAQA